MARATAAIAAAPSSRQSKGLYPIGIRGRTNEQNESASQDLQPTRVDGHPLLNSINSKQPGKPIAFFLQPGFVRVYDKERHRTSSWIWCPLRA